MSVFETALDDLFTNEDMSKAGTWFAGGIGAGVPIRLITKEPDVVSDYGAARVMSDSTVADILISQAPTLVVGDRVDFDGVSYEVQGEPTRDSQRLIWSVELVLP